MKKATVVLAISMLLVPMTSARSQSPTHSFNLYAEGIGGAVLMTGGGRFDPRTGSLHGGGRFLCTTDITQGPLAGCRAGEGVRWEALEILPSSGFKCSAEEPLRTAVTDDDTIVMKVRFYRQGDGATASFTANVFVSAVDEDPDQPGNQTVWIQQVGCAEAIVNVR